MTSFREAARHAVDRLLETIETVIDLHVWRVAHAEFEADPVRISSEEIAREFLGSCDGTSDSKE